MTLHDIAAEALEQIKRVGEIEYSSEDEKQILLAIEKAMLEAANACCVENAMVVESFLNRNKEAAMQINKEIERRRKLLISNLSAMR